MPEKQPMDGSFIVRIWWESDSNDNPVWRGQVVHAQTRRSSVFEDVDTLIVFMERWVGTLFLDDSNELNTNTNQ